MSLKAVLKELPVHLHALGAPRPAASTPPTSPRSLFVLRSNDIGDLLVVTPLFQALRERFPQAAVVAGVGDWSRAVLENNPHVSEVVSVNAPFYNHAVKPQGILDRWRYLLGPEVGRLGSRGFDVGIDPFGSSEGAVLLMRARCRYRLGVSGYRGGEAGYHRGLPHDATLPVARAVLRFAEALGARELPEARPQLFLTEAERAWGQAFWQEREKGARTHRLLMGAGAGDPSKCWPQERYVALARKLAEHPGVTLAAVGGKADAAAGRRIAEAAPGALDLCGTLSLRQTFSLLAHADLVLCNTSMLMHAAAAFRVKTLVLLPDTFAEPEAHARQWGYPETCRVLGPDTDRGRGYSVEEAHAQARDWVGLR